MSEKTPAEKEDHRGKEDTRRHRRLAGLPLELTVALADVAGATKDGLLAFASPTGFLVIRQMMEAELAERIGPKHARIRERVGSRHGSATGSVVPRGRKVAACRPRGTTDGTEIALDTWAAFSSEELLTRLVLERMFAGVATRRHADIAEPLGEGLDVVVLMIKGIVVASQCCAAALLITTDGRKVPVGLWLGDTESRTVVTDFLADLSARGLSADGGLLVVIDGARALATAVRKVFGEQALIERCTLHERRDVAGYLPKEIAERIDRRLAMAFDHPDPERGLARARAIAAELQRDRPDAAASLRGGLADMFTVRGLGVDGPLARTLTSSNPIESMMSVARTTMGRVKRWRDGTMKKRWVAAGVLEAEQSFHSVKGCSEMPVLLAALRRTRPVSHPPRTMRRLPERHPDYCRTSTAAGTSSPHE